MVRQSISSNSPPKGNSSSGETQGGVPRNATVALIGNPNTGKSSLFNALCGAKARVGNYAGVTVEHKTGRLQVGDRLSSPNRAQWQVEVVDLPGTYSLAARSADEAVSVEVLAGEMPGVPKPDAVIVILDSTNLERNLYLLSQVLELRIPVIAALNMWDRIDAEGVRIDPSKLSKSLGLPVICTSASNRTGIDELKIQLLEMLDRKDPSLGLPDSTSLASGCFPEVFGKSVDGLVDWFASEGIALNRFQVERLLIDDPQGHSFRVIAKDQSSTVQSKISEVRDALKSQGLAIPLFETRCRYGWIKSRISGVLERDSRPREHSTSDKIDRWLTHRWIGLLFFLVLMFLLFQSITLVADWPMKLIEEAQGFLGAWIESWVPPGPLRSLLVEGVLAGVGGVVVFLPQIAILFLFIGILEDCGYMSRAAFMMDKFMSVLGMSGKSFLPLMSSFACAIPGIMATRTIENRKDRMVTILIAPLMSCSARWPVYVLMVSAFVPPLTALNGWLSLRGAVLFGMVSLGSVVAIPVAWFLKRFLFPGEPSAFVMELSSYKWPSWRVVFARVWERVQAFVLRAGTLIFVTSVLVWAAAYFPANHAQLDTMVSQMESLSTDPQGHKAEIETLVEQINREKSRLIEQSFLGQAGNAIAPLVRPLGWDGKIGIAVLASFPAREVIVATLGTIYALGSGVDESNDGLADQLRAATWPDGTLVFSLATALSIMVFFALCAQCASTLMTIRRETNSWVWPIFSFLYMTTLAYVGAWVTYQVVSAWSL